MVTVVVKAVYNFVSLFCFFLTSNDVFGLGSCFQQARRVLIDWVRSSILTPRLVLRFGLLRSSPLTAYVLLPASYGANRLSPGSATTSLPLSPSLLGQRAAIVWHHVLSESPSDSYASETPSGSLFPDACAQSCPECAAVFTHASHASPSCCSSCRPALVSCTS